MDQSYGIQIQRQKKLVFKKVKSDINISKLQDDKYSLEDIIEDNIDKKGTLMGSYEEENLYLKKGQFGLYVEWGSKKRSIASINIEEVDLTLENITNFLSKNNSVLRDIDDHTNIRKGKYGEYIFIKTPNMKKPKFIGLSGFPHDILKCTDEEIKDWIKEKK